jgi:ABC-type spermidine/putrescine transport system permease subunit I
VRTENSLAANPVTVAERGWHVSDSMKGFLFVAPSLVLLIAFAAYPLASSLWLSLQEVQVFSNEHEFVGLKNYSELLSSNDFWSALWKGLVFSVATVSLQLLAGIGTALQQCVSRASAGARPDPVPVRGPDDRRHPDLEMDAQ